MAVTVGDYEIVFMGYDVATGTYSQVLEAYRPNAAIAIPHPTISRYFQLRRKGQLIGTTGQFYWYRAGTVEGPVMPQYAPRSDDYVLASLTTEFSDPTAGGQQVVFPIAQLTLRNIAYRAVAGRRFRVYMISEGPTGPNSFTVVFRTDGTFEKAQSGPTTTGSWRITPSGASDNGSCSSGFYSYATAGFVESTALPREAVVLPDGTVRLRFYACVGVNQYAIEPAG
jgi:hypothetical protein